VFDSPVFLCLDEALKAHRLLGLKRFGISFVMCVLHPAPARFLQILRKIDTFGLTSSKTKNA